MVFNLLLQTRKTTFQELVYKVVIFVSTYTPMSSTKTFKWHNCVNRWKILLHKIFFSKT